MSWCCSSHTTSEWTSSTVRCSSLWDTFVRPKSHHFQMDVVHHTVSPLWDIIPLLISQWTSIWCMTDQHSMALRTIRFTTTRCTSTKSPMFSCHLQCLTSLPMNPPPLWPVRPSMKLPLPWSMFPPTPPTLWTLVDWGLHQVPSKMGQINYLLEVRSSAAGMKPSVSSCCSTKSSYTSWWSKPYCDCLS